MTAPKVKCQMPDCGRMVKISPGGFLARHKNQAKKLCNGSGRHIEFNRGHDVR